MSTLHLDYTVLKALQEVMEEEFPLLLETFLNDSHLRLAQLQHAVDDPHALSQAAHSFKGSSSNMGAVQLAQLCRELEDQSLSLALAGRAQLVARIRDEFATVAKLYSQERDRYPS